jgi:type VI secretion system protein ImpK
LAPTTSVDRNRVNLAAILQEVFTVIVRLRSNRQTVQNAESFRNQIRKALATAEQEAGQRGYNKEDVRVAIFAAVAFLDESILNSRHPLFADWPRKPLQEELFGVHVAGEIFYRNVDRLLARPDSAQLEELLEVHELCLLLGFRGRYSSQGWNETRAVAESIAAKRRRIRALSPILFGHSDPPADQPPETADPWFQRLLWTAASCTGVAVGLFLIYKVTLTWGSELQTILGQHRL